MAKDVKIEIVGDASKYKAALADASKSSDTFSKKTKSNGDEMSKFGLGALAVGGAIGVGLFKAGEAASDLGESVNAVRVTFGESAEGILKLGEDAATAVGLSNREFNGLAVQFSSFAQTIAGKGGDVVATMDEMTGRAADFASVMNIDVGEAAAMFQSGLAGETEPLKKFGIDLSAAAVNAYAAANGIGEVGKQLTESEKVTARYGLLMESTAKTQGDFANTADSAANATRIAKAEMENAAASLGAVVAPIMAEVAGKAAMLAKGFVSLNESSGGALVGFTALVGGGALLLGTVASVIGRVQKLKATMATMSATSLGLTKALISAASVGAVVFVGLSQRANHAADAIKHITENAEELSSVADKDVLNVLNMSLAQGIANGVSLADTMKTLAQTNIEGAKRALELAIANGSSAEVIVALRRAIVDEMDATKQAATTASEFGDATDDAAGATEGLTIAQMAQKGAVDDATDAVERNKKANEALVRAVERGLDDIERGWEELTGTIDDDEAWANLQLDFMDLKTKGEEALTALKNGTEDATRLALENQVAVDGQKNKVIDYVKEVLKLPKEYATRILAAIDAGDLERAEALLANLTRNRQINIDLVGKGAPGYATGPVFAEGGVVPGPRGAPVAATVHGGEVVLNEDQQAALNGLGGGSHTVNLTVNAGLGTNGYEVAKVIVNNLAEYDRRNGTNIVTPVGR